MLLFRATSSSICTFILSSTRINTWRSKFEQDTDNILPACWSYGQKVTKVLRWLTWMYHVMHNTRTMHGRDIKTQKIGSTSILLLRKGLTFYQTRSNAIILQETLPACCIPKVVRMETGAVLYEKVYMSLRPPPKISLKHEWKRELGSEHAQRAEAGQPTWSFQSNQPTLNPIRERSGRPDITHDVIGVQDERKKRPVLRRSMLILFAKNLVLQSERGDLLRDPFRENPFMRRV